MRDTINIVNVCFGCNGKGKNHPCGTCQGGKPPQVDEQKPDKRAQTKASLSLPSMSTVNLGLSEEVYKTRQGQVFVLI